MEWFLAGLAIGSGYFNHGAAALEINPVYFIPSVIGLLATMLTGFNAIRKGESLIGTAHVGILTVCLTMFMAFMAHFQIH